MLFSQKNFVEDRRGSGHVRQLINMGFCLTEFHIVYIHIYDPRVSSAKRVLIIRKVRRR